MKRSILLALVAQVLPILAQQGPAPADYQRAVQVLEGNSARNFVQSGHTGPKAPEIRGTIESIELHRQMPLPPSALLALQLSERWRNAGPEPVSGSDGRVLFTYGRTLPTVVCALLQVCELDLEPGETLIKDSLDWGDHRFEVTPREAGAGADAFTYIVLKPTESGLDTTMTIGTDRRPYYVRLISTEHEHMARVAFLYPDDAEKRAAEAAAKRTEEARQKAETERLAKLNTVQPVRNRRYKVQLHGRDAAYLKPITIGDDGVHTHIALSEEARHRGLPVVEIRDARGAIPANAHWEGNELLIDAVFEHACLMAGVAAKQQRACITNQGLPRGEGHGHH